MSLHIKNESAKREKEKLISDFSPARDATYITGCGAKGETSGQGSDAPL
jgi:hypothetical protein